MDKKIYTVALINKEIKCLLEDDLVFNSILVQGEVTSLNKHYSGHYYFKLKGEDDSILSCVMFSYYALNYPNLKNGDEVICFGSISVYEKGGTYSLNVKKIQQSGLGKYLIELKHLEEKLTKAGYFTREKKKLPYLPSKIAILTASSGAAICDVVSSIQNRCKTGIYIFPCQVQGNDASKSIIEALDKAVKIDPDVIIITRGGGSKNDLYAFNDEELVIKIAESNIPIITAVGHSIDSSLVDKASSLSCITPTDAGVAVIKTKDEYLSRINLAKDKINKLINQKLANTSVKLINLSHIIVNCSPKNKIKQIKDKLNNCNLRLDGKINFKILQLNSYKRLIVLLDSSIKNYLINKSNELKSICSKLDALNPLNLLLNGYSLTYKDNKIITSIKDLKTDDEICLKLKDGEVKAKIINLEERKWKN